MRKAATVLAESLLKEATKAEGSVRDIKLGIASCAKKVNKYLDSVSIEVEGEMLRDVAAISCNNDAELGSIISEAYEKVGKSGVVLMEESEDDRTYVEVVDGVQLESGLKSPHLITTYTRICYKKQEITTYSS